MKRTDPLRTEQEINSFLHKMAGKSRIYFIGCVIGINWGLRASDILALTVGDVLAGSGKRVQIVDRIQIRERKTGKIRNIPVTEKMKEILSVHVKELQHLSGYSLDMPLVLSHKRRPDGKRKALARQSFWYVIDRISNELGYKRNGRSIGIHSLRKTYAYQAWRCGARVDEIQKEFGHNSLETTHRYACIPDERLDRIFSLVDYGNKTAPKEGSHFRKKGSKTLNQ